MSYKSFKPALIATNIQTVMKNRLERAKASFIINSEGESYWLYRGQKIKEHHFNLILPVDVRPLGRTGGYCSSYQNLLIS